MQLVQGRWRKGQEVSARGKDEERKKDKENGERKLPAGAATARWAVRQMAETRAQSKIVGLISVFLEIERSRCA